MSHHTKGPWLRQLISGRPGTLVVAPGDERYIASINYRGSIERTNADADLIAAAPELLEACRLLLAVRLERAGDRAADAEVRLAMAAIAKAEGSAG